MYSRPSANMGCTGAATVGGRSDGARVEPDRYAGTGGNPCLLTAAETAGRVKAPGGANGWHGLRCATRLHWNSR